MGCIEQLLPSASSCQNTAFESRRVRGVQIDLERRIERFGDFIRRSDFPGSRRCCGAGVSTPTDESCTWLSRSGHPCRPTRTSGYQRFGERAYTGGIRRRISSLHDWSGILGGAFARIGPLRFRPWRIAGNRYGLSYRRCCLGSWRNRRSGNNHWRWLGAFVYGICSPAFDREGRTSNIIRKYFVRCTAFSRPCHSTPPDAG